MKQTSSQQYSCFYNRFKPLNSWCVGSWEWRIISPNLQIQRFGYYQPCWSAKETWQNRRELGKAFDICHFSDLFHVYQCASIKAAGDICSPRGTEVLYFASPCWIWNTENAQTFSVGWAVQISLQYEWEMQSFWIFYAIYILVSRIQIKQTLWLL